MTVRASRSMSRDLAEQDPGVALAGQHLARRRGDLALGEDAGRHLVEQRLEEVVGGLRDHRHVDVGAPQRLGAEEPAEAGTDHDDPVPVCGTRCVLSVFTSDITSDCSRTSPVDDHSGRRLFGHTAPGRCRSTARVRPARWAGDPLRPRRDRHRLGQHHRDQAVRRTGGWRSSRRALFGGTCLNVGCIPTKMFVFPADLARAAQDASRPRRRHVVRRSALAGDPRPHLRPDRPDRRRAARAYRQRLPNIDLYEGHCHVRRRPHPHVSLGGRHGEQITADQIVIAAGSRVTVARHRRAGRGRSSTPATR